VLERAVLWIIGKEEVEKQLIICHTSSPMANLLREVGKKFSRTE
jgi:hypothetical protein